MAIKCPKCRVAILAVIVIVSQRAAPRNNTQANADQSKLEEILSKAKEYCRRLENAALDFVCIEAASEKIDYSKDIAAEDVRTVPDSMKGTPLKINPYPPKLVEKNSYVYEYQFIRKGPERVERRILVKKNGKKTQVENAPPMTSAVRVTNLLFGPVDLLGPARQSRYEFRIIGEESVDGQKSYVLETSPRFIVDQQHCYGRIWVKEDDSSVLKIEWNQRSLGNYNVVEATAKKYNAEPRLTSISEYGLEKKGIRFPSRDTVEEAYIMRNGKKFVRSTTTILYKDYKFFTVETEVKY